MNTDDNVHQGTESISGHHPSRHPCHSPPSSRSQQASLAPEKQARTLHCQTLGKSLECFFDHVLLFDADAPQSPPGLSPDR
jgi:hypothetical protein